MSVKEENEITVKVECSKEELLKILKNNGFKKVRIFSLDDYFYIPKNLNIENMTTRDIIAKAAILRYIVSENKISQKITFKIKEFADNGDIINQKAINCEVLDINEAKKLFKALGYYQIMNIKENDEVYSKNGFELAIKYIEKGAILIEVEKEENTEWDSIEKIKKMISRINIPIKKDEYFVKKAEIELNKILKRSNIEEAW